MRAFVLHRFLVTALTLITLIGVAQAADQRPFDGAFWKKMSASQRNLYIMGLFDGINWGRWTVRVDAIQEARDRPPGGVSKDVMTTWATDFGARNLLEQNKKFDRITAAQLVSGIDRMYSDYRNQQIPIVSLIEVVAESIKGASNAETEKRLLEMRKEVAEGSSRQQ